ncbi:MAG: endolytic transglycosylase MltG [Candidatus Competibacteraceae bacterium]
MMFPRWLRRLLLAVAALALVFGPALYIVFADYRRFLDTPLGVPAGGWVLEVKPGMGIGDIARELRRQPGLLRSAPYLEAYARLNGLAHRLKAGEYAIMSGATPRGSIEQIVAGRVIQYPLTVVEGWTFRQLRQALAAQPKLVQTLQGSSDAEGDGPAGPAGRASRGAVPAGYLSFSRRLHR